MITTAQVRKNYVPKQIQDISTIQDNTQTRQQRLQGIFREQTTGTLYTEGKQDEAIAEATLNLEGTKPDEISIFEGYHKRYYKYAWAARFKWTREVRMYDQFDVAGRGTKALGNAPTNTVVAQAVGLLELGNSTSGIPLVKNLPLVNVKAIDGLALFNTAHTFLNSAVTNSNYSATGSVDNSGITTLTNLPYSWKGPGGAPLNLRVTRLIVPWQQRQAAYEQLGSEYDPESGNNTVNSVRQDLGKTDFMVLQDLTLSNTIYALTNDPEKPTIDWGWKPRTYSDRDVMIDANMVTTDFALAVYAMSPYAIIRMGTT